MRKGVEVAKRGAKSKLPRTSWQMLRRWEMLGGSIAFLFLWILFCFGPGVQPSDGQALTDSAIPEAGTSLPSGDGSLLSVPPRTWAVETATNEIDIIEHKGSYLRYRMHVVDSKGDMVRDVIESRDGTVARTIMKNGKSLTPEEDHDERARLQAMLESPSAFAKHVKGDLSGKKLAVELIKQLPDAMVYGYAEGQPQVPAAVPGVQVVLDFRPNLKYNPPTTAAEALGGLEGRVWIDAKSKRMIRIDADIFQGVNIGWGMVAHIYPGGKISVDQTNAGGQRWIFTHFTEHVTLRALMVKTMNEHAQIDAEKFQILPQGMSYQDAIHVLLNTPLPAK